MTRPDRARYILAFSAALITFLVYLPSLRTGFVDWDDNAYVTNNPFIRSMGIDFWRWAFFDFHSYNWHPFTWISHAIDFSLWKLDPFGHHLTNILIHAINVLLVVTLFAALYQIRRPRTQGGQRIEREFLLGATVAGLLFGLHPLHVESVAWVAERKDLLCAMFFLLSIIFWIRYLAHSYHAGDGSVTVRIRHSGSYYLALAFFVFALLSKPMAVTLPILLLILDWYPFKRLRSLQTAKTLCLEKIYFLAATSIACLLTIFAQQSGKAIWEAIPLTSRMLVAMRSLVAYLEKMLLPNDLIPFYPHPRVVSLFSLEYLASTVVVILLTFFCLLTARKHGFWLLAWGWYVVMLVPVLGLIQVGGQSMADRYTYLPSLGPLGLVGLGFVWLVQKSRNLPRIKVMAYSCMAVSLAAIFGCLSYVTVRQIEIWDDSLTLWNYVIDKNPEDALLAHYYRGNALAKRGEYFKALSDYNKVIAENYQAYDATYISRGLTFLAIGQVGAAVSDFRRACSLGNLFGCQVAQKYSRSAPMRTD